MAKPITVDTHVSEASEALRDHIIAACEPLVLVPAESFETMPQHHTLRKAVAEDASDALRSGPRPWQGFVVIYNRRLGSFVAVSESYNRDLTRTLEEVPDVTT